MNGVPRLRVVRFVVVAGGLCAMAVCLGVLLMLVLRQAQAVEGDARHYLVRLAWVCLVMLLLTLLILLWVAGRFVLDLMRAQRPPEPTPYVDAWAEAGRRFRLEDHKDADPGEDAEAAAKE